MSESREQVARQLAQQIYDGHVSLEQGTEIVARALAACALGARQEERRIVVDNAMNVVSYFFDTHSGMINTNVARDVLLGRLAAFGERAAEDK